MVLKKALISARARSNRHNPVLQTGSQYLNPALPAARNRRRQGRPRVKKRGRGTLGTAACQALFIV
jgi:hypothetical protein